MIRIPSEVRYDKTEKQSELSVTGVFYMTYPEGVIGKDRFVDPSEFIYVIKGKLQIVINGQCFFLQAADAISIRQYSVISDLSALEGGCTFYSISYSSTVERYNDLYLKVVGMPERSSTVETLLAGLNYYSLREHTASFLLDSSMILILESIYDMKDRDPDRLQIHGIINYINENIMLPLAIEEISEHFHYSHDYIAKIFKEQFGITIKQYIIQKKISVAKRLLSTSELPVVNVGEAVGFADPILFDKFFKYHTGITPKKYRSIYK